MNTKSSTFKVMFYIQRAKIKPNGNAPIMVRITVNGEQACLSTRLDINPTRWLPKEHRTAGGTAEEKEINGLLDKLKFAIIHRYYDFQAACEVITASKIKRALTSINDTPFRYIELCNSFLADYEKLSRSRGYGFVSLMKYQLIRRRLEEFIKEEYKVADIPLADVNKRFLNKLYLWLCTERHLSNNTAIKFIHSCSSIYKVAIDNGWVRKNPFALLNLHFDKVDRGYVTQEELSRMMHTEFDSKKLELVRDLFVFSCYTGLPYVDLTRLSKGMLAEHPDGTLWIKSHRQKTKVPISIRLLDVPRNILSKYAEQAAAVRIRKRAGNRYIFEPSDKLLIVPSNSVVNAHLKKIAALCEIDKDLTFHTARHTFATTITLSNGVPIESVSKMLGHTNIKTTQLYARITDQKISHDMDILAQKLDSEGK